MGLNYFFEPQRRRDTENSKRKCFTVGSFYTCRSELISVYKGVPVLMPSFLCASAVQAFKDEKIKRHRKCDAFSTISREK